MAAIVELSARKILGSYGNPAAKVEVLLEDGAVGHAMAPPGASIGIHEVYEPRDGGDRHLGKSIEKTVRTVLKGTEDVIIGLEAEDQHLIDKTMIELDDTGNKPRLSANATLGMFMTVVKAAAESTGLDLLRYVGGPNGYVLPVPIMNILNGGTHANSGVDVQGFVIAPIGTPAFKEALRVGAEVYHVLKKVTRDKGLSTGFGDEGGFAPSVDSTKTALDLIVEAIEVAGYKLGDNVALVLDTTSSEFYKDGKYHFKGGEHIAEEMTAVYADLIENYATASVEDPLQEDDQGGRTKLTAQIGDKVQIVGNDFFVTNLKRLAEGIEKKAVNAPLVKVSQIGSLSETLEAVAMAHNASYKTMMPHRSGETEDATIADLAVGLNCDQIRTGVPVRSERAIKYNQLLRIEEYLSDATVYAGRSVFPRLK